MNCSARRTHSSCVYLCWFLVGNVVYKKNTFTAPIHEGKKSKANHIAVSSSQAKIVEITTKPYSSCNSNHLERTSLSSYTVVPSRCTHKLFLCFYLLSCSLVRSFALITTLILHIRMCVCVHVLMCMQFSLYFANWIYFCFCAKIQ